MDYERLTSLLANSAAVKLLRAKTAPLILSFLYREFKEKNRLIISNHELVNRLSDYLDAVGLLDEENQYVDFVERARRYIDDWCNEENRYLRKFPDESGVSVHELTSDAERAFQWIDSLERKEFIGTESRFLDIFAKLRNLIENSSEDPEKRIEELEKRKRAIEDQIRDIRISGKVETFSDTQIKERFFEINKLGRELIADFKEVERNFMDITRNIYEQQTRKDVSKGAILGYTLDSTDDLKDSDQGKSFYAFWRFLIADHKQDELNKLIEQVFTILIEKRIPNTDPFLRNIKIFLHDAGRKVVSSNHRLVGKLSRILGEKYILERKKTIELITDIKKLAMERIEDPPTHDPFLEIEGNCDVRLVMDRPLGEPKREAAFVHQPVEVGDAELEMADFDKLFNQFEIDKEMLRKNIEALLMRQSQATLEEVVRNAPIQKGLAEIVAYISIASASRRHIIDSDSSMVIEWMDDEVHKKLRMPRVIYGRGGRSA